MANSIKKFSIVLVIALFVWIIVSSILSWLFILYHGIECHFNSISIFLERHQVWTAFAIVSGVLLPGLPNKIHLYIWKNELTNEKTMRYMVITIALVSLVYGQLLDSQVFEKCV